jgi:hypothetical protein
MISKSFIKYKKSVISIIGTPTWMSSSEIFINRYKNFEKYEGGSTRILKIINQAGISLKGKFSSEKIKSNALNKYLIGNLALFEAEGSKLTREATDKKVLHKASRRKYSKFAFALINWLIQRSKDKKIRKSNFSIKIKSEVLAKNLKMYAFIKKRQWKRINETLQQCFDMALQLNYILELPKKEQNTLGSDMYVIYLNPQKFKAGE